jgi:hypothetical protein
LTKTHLQHIPGAKVSVKSQKIIPPHGGTLPPAPPTPVDAYTFMVTLPKLQSTTNSLKNLGISLDTIWAPLLKTIYSKQSK